MPSQKFGVERPQSAIAFAPRGPTTPPRPHGRHRCRPECRSRARSSSPAPRARASPAASARRAASTGCCVRTDSPRSPCAARRRSSSRSAAGSESSRWSVACRYATTFGSCSSPARITAGSPGSNCCRPKISIETKTSVGTIVARRLIEELEHRSSLRWSARRRGRVAGSASTAAATRPRRRLQHGSGRRPRLRERTRTPVTASTSTRRPAAARPARCARRPIWRCRPIASCGG